MSNEPVLVVGGTGHLGGQVVDALQQRGKQVRALVRPTSEASKLEAKGVEVVRGDMLDKRSLAAAMSGVDAVVSTAAGYTRRNKNATEIDTVGQANLAEAAADTDVRRFVLTSILTCDLTPQVSTSGTRSSPRTRSSGTRSRSSHCVRVPSSTWSPGWAATRSRRSG